MHPSFNEYLRDLKKKFAKVLAKTPIYPHWMEFKKSEQLRRMLISLLYGDVVEVGSGEGKLKLDALESNRSICNYISTDYSGWEASFTAGAQLSQGNDLIAVLHLREPRQTLDCTCSALYLPFEDAAFDCHVSTEVLEHIADPFRFFSEAARVVRPGGMIVLTCPFLYRIHPDDSADFFRPLPGWYRWVADEFNLKMRKIVSNTGIGATCSSLINQWIIRQYLEKNPSIVWRIFFIMLMPFVFCCTNIMGWFVDKWWPDSRFAMRFLVVMTKP